MAIQNRRGPKASFDPNKMLAGEFGYALDTAELYYCYSPGNVKRLLTSDDVQGLLNASPEAYAALQELLEDLENDPNELANILNKISGLQGTIKTQVNTLAELKAITGMIEGSLVMCKGLGLYRYDYSSSATADDFFIVAPSLGAGRWILMAETAIGFSPDTGTANTFVLTLSGLTAYYSGMMVLFKAAYANTGTCTINVNVLGAKSLVRPGGIGLAAGDITAGSLICAVYDGTSFQIISNLATNLVHLTATQTLTNKALTSPILTTPKMASGTNINDANGNELIRFPAAVASAVNEITVNNSATGVAPSIQASGTDANVGLSIMSKGTSTIRAYVNSVVSAVFDAVSSAVNYLTIKSNVAGSAPTIESGGTDANVGIDVKTKGTGVFRTLVNGVVSFVVDTVASAVNYLTVKANTAGNAPTIAATGTDTNIDVNVVPKGTGRLKENGTVVVRQGEDYRPNILINGDFQVWQRGTTFDKTSTAGIFYGPDRWAFYRNNAVAGLIISKINNGLTILNPNTTSYAIISQSLEKGDVIPLRDKTVTVSVKMKSSVSATCSLQTNYSNTGEILQGGASTGAIGSKSFTVGTSFSVFSITFVVPSDALGLNPYVFMPAVAATYTIEYMKLEVNDHATPHVSRSYGDELALCQRYFLSLFMSGVAMSNGHIFISTPFPVEMRTYPTKTFALWSTNAGATPTTYYSSAGPNYLYVDGQGGAATALYSVGATLDAEI